MDHDLHGHAREAAERGYERRQVRTSTGVPWKVIWTEKRAWLVAKDGTTICGTGDSTKGRELEAAAHAANAYPKLVDRTQRAPMLAWEPQHFIGFSEEQIALIKRGWDAAMNRVWEGNSALLRELGEDGHA
jgi:hypothetical protein